MSTRKIVWGISEWPCWYGDRQESPAVSTVDDANAVIDECIGVHEAVGIRRLAWNLGRSTIDYWSDLPNTTQAAELSTTVGRTSWAFVRDVMDRVCPLRRALAAGVDRGLTVYGRLGMNRHYGTPEYSGVTSQFSLDHPEYRARGKRGAEISWRLCYAIPEVRRERIDILLEAQRIGVGGLVLDFCRQMPMLSYHDAVVQPYIKKTGTDPRTIDSARPEDYADWFQFRADILTGFMRDLRAAVRKQETELGRPCPLVARVPDSAPWLMIAYSLDVARWFREDLIDATMLSPFPRSRDGLQSYPEWHVQAAHGAGKECIGGIGTYRILGQETVPTLRPAYARALRQHEAGVDAMSLYQSETVVRRPRFQDMARVLGDARTVAERAATLPEASDETVRLWQGCDWHSNPSGRGEGLSVADFGDAAL